MAEQTERTDSEKSRRLKDAGGGGGGGAPQAPQAEDADRTEGAAARRVAAAAAAPPPPPPPAPAPGEAAFSSEERECRVCYNPFDPDARAPKLLECLHTFCLDCLSQMQQHQAQGEGGGGGGSERGAPPAITCPLCRHRTVLPRGRARNLPPNTKLAPPRLPAERLLQLLPLSRAPGPARLQRPLPGQSGHQATPSGDPAAPAPASTGRHEPPRQSSRQEIRTVRCVCIVFTFFSMMVVSITGPLFLNYSGWVELFMVSLFLVVAIVLAVVSIMPYLRLLHTHEYRAVAAALLAGEGAGGPRGAALGPVTTPGRSLARAGQG